MQSNQIRTQVPVSATNQTNNPTNLIALTNMQPHVFVPPPPASSSSSRSQILTTTSAQTPVVSQLSTIQLPTGLKLEQSGIKIEPAGVNSAVAANIVIPSASTQPGHTFSTGNITQGIMTTNAVAVAPSNTANQGHPQDLPSDPDVSAFISVKPDPLDTSKLKFSCTTCQFSPRQISSLVEHINGVHLKRKNIQCSMCPFKTSRKKSLTSHMNEVHLKEKRYPCQHCEFKGARKASLDKHMQSKHGGHQCKLCNFTSKKETDFRTHMLVSHNISEGVAQIAQVQAAQANSNGGTENKTPYVTSDQLITYDSKIEHGFCCSICKYAPTSMRYLRDHIRKVHLSKLIKCPHCDLKTKRKADLLKHIKRLHPDSPESQQAQMQHLQTTPQPLPPNVQITATKSIPAPTILNPIPQSQLQNTSQQNDALLTAAIKSEIPIALHWPNSNLQPVQTVGQIPAGLVPQQPVHITLNTIDASALLNTYPTPQSGSSNVQNTSQAQQIFINQQPTQNQHQPTQTTVVTQATASGNQAPTNPNLHNPTKYKKGMHQEFDPSTKCDDLILYSDIYASGLGCSICNYAPNSLRYLRDHIRKVHLAKTYKCQYCSLKTKRRADLVRHVKRIHEDPKRNANNTITTIPASSAAEVKMELPTAYM